MMPRMSEDMYGSRVATKLVDATGATPITLFTVTGDVIVRLIAIVKEAWTTSDAITAEIGVAGNTAAIVAQVADATQLAINEIYHDNAPDATIEAEDTIRSFIVSAGQDIILTTTGTVTNGELMCYLFWRPLSTDGQVVST